MGGRMGSGCWNKLIKAEVLRDIRYKPYVMGEDVEMLCRTLDNCIFNGYYDLSGCFLSRSFHWNHLEQDS